MVPVTYSIDEHILTNITNITSIFSQLFNQSILVMRTSGTNKDYWYYASNNKNKSIIIYLYP